MNTPKRVLLVEDDDGTRMLIEKTLTRKFACTVSVAPSASSARALASGETFDLAILDYQLGNGALGTKLLPDLRCIATVGVAILITGYVDDQLDVTATAVGFSTVVQKSEDFFGKLVAVVRSLGLSAPL